MSTDLNHTASAVIATPRKARRNGMNLASIAARGSLVMVLIALVVVFALINGSDFFAANTFKLILSTQAAVGVIALAVTIASVTGQVDLSVASVMGGAAGITAMQVADGSSPVVAMAQALTFALVFGLANGFLVTVGRMSSIIATLATGTIATGVGLALVGTNTIAATEPAFLNMFSSTIGGIQTAFFILVAITIVAVVVLQWTRLGRRLFFVGQNRDAAGLLGIKVRQLTIGGMVAAALLAGFAGIMLTGQNGGASVTQTSGYLLPVFAASYLGTSAIVPGRFNAAGTFIATYVLGTASLGLNMAGVPQWSSYLFNGGLLIISLGAFEIVNVRKTRVAKRESIRAAAAAGAEQ